MYVVVLFLFHPLILCIWLLGCVGQVRNRLVGCWSKWLRSSFWSLRSSDKVLARASLVFFLLHSSKSLYARASTVGLQVFFLDATLARASFSSLERAVLRSSMRLFLFWTWRLCSLARASDDYVLSFFALARTSTLERASGLQTWSFVLFTRAKVFALERGSFVSGRSSDHSFAWASLEYISCSSVFLLYFFISFYFQTLDSTLSLSTYTFSLQIPLVLGHVYPNLFVRNVELGGATLWSEKLDFGALLSFFIFSFGILTSR